MTTEEVPWYVSLIVSWLPFLMLIWLGVFISRRIRKALRADDGRSVGQVLDEQAREMHRTNDMLEKMVNDYRVRIEALEQKH
jgi:hypothetical protein